MTSQPSSATTAPSTGTSSDKTCDLCDGTDFDTIARRDRRGRPLETVVCRQCGLVAHAAIPSAAELDDYYARQYRKDYHGEHTPSARRVMRAWKNAERIYSQLAPQLRGDEDVFDLGAGIGCAARLFELNGYHASGIDPGAGFLGYSQQTLKAQVRQGVLQDLDRSPCCDLVLLVHVIEHFRSPHEALSHIHDLLRPGGRLYVECPNLAAPFAPRSKLFHFAHIHNFTPETLAMLGRRCGFRVAQRFGGPEDPNLQILFERVSSSDDYINPESYYRTIRALNKYGPVGYHLRRSYLVPRIQKLASYLHEHLTARRYVAELVERCQSAASRVGKSTVVRSASRSAA